MNSKLLIVVVFLLAAGGIFYYTTRKNTETVVGGATQGANAERGLTRPDATEITFVYSTEKKDWVEAATRSFAQAHPEISVKLVGKGSLDEAQALVDGKDQPTLWSPADSLVMSLAAADWTTKSGSALVAEAGTDDAPQPLVVTPLVIVAWEDRAQALLKHAGGKLTWSAIHDAVTSDQGWPAVGGKADWGFVKLGHTDPTRSNSGLQALVSMMSEYFKKTSGFQVADVLNPKFQLWLKQTEGGVTKFETSTGTFMTDMIRFGPSKYDLAVVYENLATSQLENAQGRWGNLRIYYPTNTLWSDHPVAVLQGAWVTEPQKKAARVYVAYLRSRPMQEEALHFGFRPADPSVPVKTPAPNNPFTRLADYGVRVDIPTAVTPPDPAVVRNLMTLWSRTVGNR